MENSDLCVYFDLLHSGVDIDPVWYMAIPVFALCVVASVTFRGIWRRYVLTAAAFVGLVMSFVVLLLAGEYLELRTGYSEGAYQVSRGMVSEFVASVDDSPEIFVVDGYRFEMRPYRESVAFQKVSHQGGPLFEGLYVEIWHIEGKIIHLEVPCE